MMGYGGIVASAKKNSRGEKNGSGEEALTDGHLQLADGVVVEGGCVGVPTRPDIGFSCANGKRILSEKEVKKRSPGKPSTVACAVMEGWPRAKNKGSGGHGGRTRGTRISLGYWRTGEAQTERILCRQRP